MRQSRLAFSLSLFLIGGLCGCAGGTAGALNQILPGAEPPSRTTASLPSGTRVYDIAVSAILSADRQYTLWIPSRAIVSQTATTVTIIVAGGKLKTLTNVTVEQQPPSTRMTVTLKPGMPVPPALKNVEPSSVVP